MKVLQNVAATPEQLQVLQHKFRIGVLIIRGAAGSGKTTTALLRIRHLLVDWSRALKRSDDRLPRVLVLTYNRTLRGYISELAEQATGSDVEVETFARWARTRLGNPDIISYETFAAKIDEYHRVSELPHSSQFVREEVDYVLGRLETSDLATYISEDFQRDGRGLTPRLTRAQRQVLLEKVIGPYNAWKGSNEALDWNDLANQLIASPVGPFYDIVVVDETQDFTANRVRAILAHTEPKSSTTFVLDAAQRIYPHYFHWSEVGIDATSRNVCLLGKNHRNTKEIAAFARPLVDGLAMGPDASMPNLDSCAKGGSRPIVLLGKYSSQVDWALRYLREVDTAVDSVAFLHPKGGGYFNYLRTQLQRARIPLAELQASRDWPSGPVNVGLSTMQSAKGLEFDHVLILGLNDEMIDCGDAPDHVYLESARRLLAMAVTRARKSVILGYKPDDAPALIQFLDPSTFEEILV